MAYTKKTPKKGLKIVTPGENQPPAEQLFTDPPAVTAPAQPAAPVESQQKRGAKTRGPAGSFWQAVAAVPQADWEAKRTYIYLYILEPFANIKTEGEAGYVQKYFEPIDPDYVMQRWGSGKYFVRLKTKRNPGDRADQDIDRYTFDIINPDYPPRLPRKMWENDPRNEKWLAMLKEVPPPPAPGDAATMLNTFLDIQDRIEQRMDRDQPEPAEHPATQLDALVSAAAKIAELAKPAQNGAAVDPWAAAERIMNMRAENPMVTILMAQLEQMNKANEAAREREFQLQKELRQMTRPAEAETDKPKSLLDQLKESKEILTSLGISVGENGGRLGKKGWIDLLEVLVPQVANAPILNALAARLMNAGPQPMMQPANGHQPQQNGAPQGMQQDFLAFVNGTVTPAMLSYLEADASGTNFAEWLYAGFPEKMKTLQNVTHPSMPGQQGAPVIIALYKQSQAWQRIQFHEERFNKFVAEFCAWKPDEEKPVDTAGDDGDGESEAPERIEV